MLGTFLSKANLILKIILTKQALFKGDSNATIYLSKFSCFLFFLGQSPSVDWALDIRVLVPDRHVAGTGH